MHPILFKFNLPQWLLKLLPFLPETISLYSYGVLIATGAFLVFLYTQKEAKKLGISTDKTADLFLWAILASFIGGKVFYYLQDPQIYIQNPSKLIPTGSGFVFYGSLLFAIPTMWYFFKKKQIPTRPMLDIIAFAGPIVHSMGRLGCFMAGCCHGLQCDPRYGIVFNHELTAAVPKGVPLIPTQLYEALALLIILALLFYLKAHKKFHGQLFLVYITTYAIWRSFIEILRGDYERGFVIDGYISNSQFISLLLLVFVFFIYKKWSKNAGNEPIKAH